MLFLTYTRQLATVAGIEPAYVGIKTRCVHHFATRLRFFHPPHAWGYVINYKRMVASILKPWFVVSAGLAIFQVYGPAKYTKDIASLMGISWGAISGAFIGPFFYGLYWKKTTKASVYASFISGILISVVSLILSLTGVNAKLQANGILWFDFLYHAVAR